MNLITALETLTVPELRKLAAEARIAGRSSMRKAELIAALADHPLTETRVAISDLPSLRPEATAAEAGTTADPELREAEVAEAYGQPLPLTRRQAEHLVIIDQQRGDVPEEGFTREAWLNRGRVTMEERWLDAPGATALSDAYRIVLGLLTPVEFTLLLSSVRGDDYPGSGKFGSLTEAEAHVRRNLTGISSVWRVRVLDQAGTPVRIAVRSGHNASGKSWIWGTPITDAN